MAERGAATVVTLPGGLPGQWSDVRNGETVEIGGTYDDASQVMFDTDHIHIQSLPPAQA